MSVSYRILAVVFRLLRWLGFFKWAIIVVLALIALGRMILVGAGGPLWLVYTWGPPVLLLGGSIVAALNHYTVFIPDPAMVQLPACEPPAHAHGLATGLFRIFDRFAWVAPEVQHQISVQVRWLDGMRPPVLAVMRPVDIPADLKEPLEEADEYCLWHPGVDVTSGWLVTVGRTYPALRLRFVGKSMVLAVGSEATAVAYMHALRA